MDARVHRGRSFRTADEGLPVDRDAYLLLEDGRRFDGTHLGAEGTAFGEVVFNTAMTGYQEVLTDPSYTGQLVTMTYPLIGNYGVNSEDLESVDPKVAGFIVREASRMTSSWRSEGDLDAYLEAHGIAGIADVDTRALTRHIRAQGAMRGAIASAVRAQDEVLEEILAQPKMEGLDLACGVSTGEPYEVPASGEERFRVLAYDFGVKAHSPKLLAERGCRVTVIPAETPVEEILADPPDGLFISNGPGDPAAVEQARQAILRLSEADVPVFGICLGHQLICRAFGAETYKLAFGHHGANHPVKNLDRQSVEITSQNHGFAVRGGEGDEIPGAPDLRLTHVNLYDGTVEGVEHRSRPVLAVQYHPEAAPGPHDSRYLFDRFIELMQARSVSEA
ncbi:MAG: glutamine-hydrolyzing carbamoyl-phosphate synthase small subunit [Longimicrobiales bacterium]|nr:glutamine-hydrolyzing carbamoyl-phosphate synthase small subunit [Longimicrobiales bacterium]